MCFKHFIIVLVKGEGESGGSLKHTAHSLELKSGRLSDEATIVANQSSKTTLNWGFRAPVEGFKTMGVLVVSSVREIPTLMEQIEQGMVLSKT
jgi:hypothetical protein